MSIAKRPEDKLVVFIGAKQASPESVQRYCDKLVASCWQRPKNGHLKKILSGYRISKELTAKEAIKLKLFLEENQ